MTAAVTAALVAAMTAALVAVMTAANTAAEASIAAVAASNTNSGRRQMATAASEYAVDQGEQQLLETPHHSCVIRLAGSSHILDYVTQNTCLMMHQETGNVYAIEAAKKRSRAICADVGGPSIATVLFTAVTVCTCLPCRIEPRKMEATEIQ